MSSSQNKEKRSYTQAFMSIDKTVYIQKNKEYKQEEEEEYSSTA